MNFWKIGKINRRVLRVVDRIADYHLRWVEE
jgi:hypothetical protein